MTNNLPQYTHPDHVKFVEDIQAAGHEVFHYKGRMFWQGPAVELQQPSDVTLLTDIDCQYDNYGLEYVVYPQAYNPECLEQLKDYAQKVGMPHLTLFARGAQAGIVLPDDLED